MKHDFATAMRRALDLTRTGDVATATTAIQDALARAKPASPPASRKRPSPSTGVALRRLVQRGQRRLEREPSERVPKPLGEVLSVLREGRLRTGLNGSLPSLAGGSLMRTSQPPPIPEGAKFLARSFSCEAGARSYKLYVPASSELRGLVVMLHGCNQDPDDFARGTNMNAIAEAHGVMVAYPAQTASANPSTCWNWFNPADQMRGGGEPSIIAGITLDIVSEFGIERDRVYVAGLSAGGAMSAVMGETYPDLYAAVGIHSGLPYRSANDVVSAFAVMHGDASRSSQLRPAVPTKSVSVVRTIVFHGSEDRIVHPCNADKIVDAVSRNIGGVNAENQHGRSPGGLAYTRSIIRSPEEAGMVEFWLIDGIGHAWSGGQPNGSYTSPNGPDASIEMMRFFLKR